MALRQTLGKLKEPLTAHDYRPSPTTDTRSTALTVRSICSHPQASVYLDRYELLELCLQGLW